MNNRSGTTWTVAGLLAVSVAFSILAAPTIWASPAPATAATGSLAQDDFEYVGSNKCKKCHLPQFKSWEKTTMANTIEVLQPGERVDAKLDAGLDPDADYTDDPTCLECHTVGYGEPGGFESLDATPNLAGTGCEACHGPGSAYIADNVMGNKNKKHSFDEVIAKGLVFPVPEDTCRKCHNERSPFNADLDPKYEWVYSKETLDEQTHRHLKLKYDHGPLPAGTLLQEPR